MWIDPVQAVEIGQDAEPEDWEDPDLQLPMDHAGIAEGILPLLGMALFIAFVLVRSVSP